MRFHTKTHYCGRYYRNRPISIVGLHVFRDSKRDAEGWVGQKWQCQRDAIIEQCQPFRPPDLSTQDAQQQNLTRNTLLYE